MSDRSVAKFSHLPNDRLFPFPPIATQDICFWWLLKIISPHNQTPSILPLTTIVSPQMLDFFQGKGEAGVRNVIPKRISSPEDSSKAIIGSMKCTNVNKIAYNLSPHQSSTRICCSNWDLNERKKKIKPQKVDIYKADCILRPFSLLLEYTIPASLLQYARLKAYMLPIIA